MRARRSTRATLMIALVIPMLAAACGGSDDPGSTPTTNPGATTAGGGAQVDATLADFSIALDPAEIDAGDATFTVVNNGPTVHEFVIFSTEFDEDTLPLDEAGTAVDEGADGIVVVDELEDLDPDTTTDLDVTLDAGHYVVICNVEGHYQSGMHTTLTVV